jgi:hypothetical protein
VTAREISESPTRLGVVLLRDCEVPELFRVKQRIDARTDPETRAARDRGLPSLDDGELALVNGKHLVFCRAEQKPLWLPSDDLRTTFCRRKDDRKAVEPGWLSADDLWATSPGDRLLIERLRDQSGLALCPSANEIPEK